MPLHYLLKFRVFTLIFAVFLSFASAELLFVSLQGLSVECNERAEYHVQLKLAPSLCNFCLFWQKWYLSQHPLHFCNQKYLPWIV